MKKTLLTFVAFFAMVSMALAQTLSWTSADWTGVTEKAQTISAKFGDFTLTADKNEGRTNPTVASTNDLRVYALGSLTLTSTKNVQKFVCNVSKKGHYRLADITANVGSVAIDVDAWTVTWTGDANNVVLTVGENAVHGTDGAAKAGQFCIDNIVIGEGGGEVNPEPQPEPQPEEGVAFSADFATDMCGFTIEDKTLSEGLKFVWSYNEKFHTMKATAAVGKEHTPYASESWAVSPVIDLTKVQGATLTFINKANFFGSTENFNAACSVKVKAEGETAWKNVVVEGGATGMAWDEVTSTADLKAYDGKKIQIAFAYTSTTEFAGTWEFVNVKVAGKGGEVKPEPQPEPQPEDGAIFSETFAKDQGAFTIEDKLMPEGSKFIWQYSAYQGKAYMKASAFFGGKGHDSESWLISPVIDLTKATECALSFDNAANFFKGTLATACVVKVKVEGGEWSNLVVENMPANDSWDFVTSTVDLKAFDGKKIQIAFVYTSTAEVAGTWEVKNVKVDGNAATGIEGVEAENGEQVIYDLSGRRVAKAVKGLYIINGKKVFVK